MSVSIPSSVRPALLSLALAALTIGGTLAPRPAHALTTDPIPFAFLTAVDVVATPETVYLTATAGPRTWQSLIDLGAPFLSPYAEAWRQYALNRAPRLTPRATPPRPPAITIPNSYTQVISFGDSMSDTGNMFEVTRKIGGVGFPTAPNDRGRFADGQVVVEVMSNALNRPLLNYAFGGGQSGRGNLLPLLALQHGMLKQIDDYIANLGTPWTRADGNALYVLWTGPDDFYWGNNIYLRSTVWSVTANLQQGMTTLYKRGARHFFVPEMPDLSITPSAREHAKLQRTYMTDSRARSSELAQAVQAMLRNFARQYPDATVRSFPTYTYSQQRVAQAAAEGYNVTTPCYTPAYMGLPGTVCADPTRHLFWDTNHPTEAGAMVLGTAFAEAMLNAPLPSR
ncbi:hypothetical protein GTZ97_14375 [Aquabacterium fontiphilum]|jgi:outer membrane lipase/esterase|uniref:SGNH/GDSL hydrolase family protein n=1 Tax=Aquabacterium fontiphilum TaxID=450365 RepID=UPI0013770687|nr:SGNH/GDSL hydrolase family protein [Aquabacterium fontiphilum]NBD21846.1 hypothetical protein [Aquabacterium fontiphilum]